MARKIILALIILILIALIIITLMPKNNVDIYIDGENVSVETTSSSADDIKELNEEICEYTLFFMNGTDVDINHLRNNISSICAEHGADEMEINIDSSIGKNQIPVIAEVSGTSMVPTLQDGQEVLFNKTHNIHVGDIVVAESPEYGGIIKRVGDIDGNSVYLISDNKEVSYEVINGQIYELKGITTWVDISDINGVVIGY